jgi:hypothetical protein
MSREMVISKTKPKFSQGDRKIVFVLIDKYLKTIKK